MLTETANTLDTTPAPATTILPHRATPELPTILLVDDSAVQRRIVHSLLDAAGSWHVIHANDGVAALEQIERAQPHLVLTDVYMPKMDGLALVEHVRDRFPSVPVVLMTGHGSEQIAVSALKAGAADYIPKRAMVTDLGRILDRVLTNSRAEMNRVRLLAGMTGRISRFRLQNDARLVEPLIAQLRDDMLAVGVCTRHEVTRVGIALEEGILNAIYHGNLEISSKLKEKGDDSFYKLAAERAKLSPFAERRVQVVARITPNRATFAIADEGPGFDVSAIPDPTAIENLERPCGRGLLLMRAFMDEVRFNTTGNRLTLVKTKKA